MVTQSTYKRKLTTLEDSIAKHGEEKGRRIFEGTIKAKESKKVKYAAQPFKRMTKEWYIWRYGETEGTSKFNEFARKSAHKLDIFVEKYGIEEGERRYKETIAKKSTAQVTIQKIGIEAYKQSRVEAAKKLSISVSNRTPEQKQISREKRKQTLLPFLGMSKLEEMCARYGEIAGKLKYENWLCKIAIAPRTITKQAQQMFLSLVDYLKLDYNEVLEDRSILFGIKTKKEFFLYDSLYSEFYSYDYTFVNKKVIIEYDGFQWHPTELQAKETPTKLVPTTKWTYSQKYAFDMRKKTFADSKGFVVFTIRSDDNEEIRIEKFKKIKRHLENEI